MILYLIGGAKQHKLSPSLLYLNRTIRDVLNGWFFRKKTPLKRYSFFSRENGSMGAVNFLNCQLKSFGQKSQNLPTSAIWQRYLLSSDYYFEIEQISRLMMDVDVILSTLSTSTNLTMENFFVKRKLQYI